MRQAKDILQPFGIGISIRLLPLLFAASVMVEVREARGQGSLSKEYEVKAACLLNFAQFIEWPAAAFPKPETPITIGVLGDDPFGAALEQTFQDEVVQGRKVVVKRSKQVEDLKSCHMLFISNSEKDRLTEILTSLKDASVMTVGDMDEMTNRGGIIKFYIEDKKVRFEINVGAAKRKSLKISSQLLKRARIVG